MFLNIWYKSSRYIKSLCKIYKGVFISREHQSPYIAYMMVQVDTHFYGVYFCIRWVALHPARYLTRASGLWYTMGWVVFLKNIFFENSYPLFELFWFRRFKKLIGNFFLILVLKNSDPLFELFECFAVLHMLGASTTKDTIRP